MSKKSIEEDSPVRNKKGSRLNRFLKWLEQGRIKAATSGCKA